MMLHPLAEVGVGMLVPIVVGRSQLVMDVLCHCKRRNGEQEKDKADRPSAPKNKEPASYRRAQSH